MKSKCEERRPNNWNTFSVTSRKKLLSFQCRTLRLKRVTSKVQAEREKKWRARKLNSSKLAFSLSPFLLLSLSLRLKFRKGLISFFRPPTKALFLGFKGHGSADRPLTLGLGSSLNFPEIFWLIARTNPKASSDRFLISLGIAADELQIRNHSRVLRKSGRVKFPGSGGQKYRDLFSFSFFSLCFWLSGKLVSGFISGFKDAMEIWDRYGKDVRPKTGKRRLMERVRELDRASGSQRNGKEKKRNNLNYS